MATAAPMPVLTHAALAEQLGGLLTRLTERYTRAHRLLADHREAIRKADGAAVVALVEQQSAVLADIETLDKRRRELVAAASASFPTLIAVRGKSVTLTQLASILPEGDRVRLTAAADNLRRLAQDVRDSTASIRAATATLLAHMEGLIRQVGKQLSHAGTYGRRGVVESGSPVLSALDLRT